MRTERTFCAIIAVALLTACGDDRKPASTEIIPTITYRSLALTTPASVLTAINDTIALKATATDANGAQSSPPSLSWMSSDAQVVSVTTEGVGSARKEGAAWITVRLGALRDSVLLTVKQAPATIELATAGAPSLIKALGATLAVTATVSDRTGHVMPGQSVGWSVTDTAIASIDVSGALKTRGRGRAEVVATLGALSARWPFEVATKVRPVVDAYLATPIANAKWEIPVVVVSYIPTADGKTLDVSKSPDFYTLNPLTLAQTEANILDIVKRKKMAIEQGSRFRGYANASAQPSLGIRVVEYINVYELLPASARPGVTPNTKLPDWLRVFADLGLDTLIRNRGVKQVWMATSSFDASFPSYNPAMHSMADARYVWESNMSSPTTGDVSNSDRFAGDLPVLDHTYIMYGINFRRSQSEAIHNVGHQLEAMFAHVNQVTEGNTNLFWKSFVGQDAAGAFITGRAGWTHMPPNTVTNYDYLSTTSVPSDIEDWRPDGTGQKKPVNVNTWGQLTYPWPGAVEFGQRVEAQWYTYWFQNMPGLGNTIPRGTGVMTNWWQFMADWDGAIRAGVGLATGR